MSIKITFDFTAGQIIIDGEEGDLLALAKEAKSLAPTLSEIRIVTQQRKSIEDLKANSSEIQSIPAQRQPAIREFAKSLSLSNTYEKVAALVYHAIKFQNKSFVTVKELSDWFGLCGFQKPAQMPVAVSDASRKYGYVESKGRDQWTITTGGENLIIGMLEQKAV